MDKIVLEITEQDIKKYIGSHSDDKNLEYRKELLIKYLKESETLTRESYEILMGKIFPDQLEESQIPTILPSFEDYTSSIRNLDMSGICHILIPSLGCLEKVKQGKLFEWKPLEISVQKLVEAGRECKCRRTTTKDLTKMLEDTLDIYQMVGDVSIKEKMDSSFLVSFPKPFETYRGILGSYEKVYGEGSVQKVRRIAMRKD